MGPHRLFVSLLYAPVRASGGAANILIAMQRSRTPSGPLDALRRPRVRGSAVLMRQSFVRNKYGGAAADMFEARASPGLKTALMLSRQRDEWVDFGLFVEATELVDSLFGRGNLALAWEVGRFAAEHNMAFWRSLVMRVVSPRDGQATK